MNNHKLIQGGRCMLSKFNEKTIDTMLRTNKIGEYL